MRKIILLTVIALFVHKNVLAFDLDLKKLKDTVEQIKSQQNSQPQSLPSENDTKDIINQKTQDNKISNTKNSSQDAKNTLGKLDYNPIDNYDTKDADSYCKKITESNVVKQIIEFNKVNSNSKERSTFVSPSTEWSRLKGTENQLGIFLWDSLKINEKTRNSFDIQNQLNSNIEIIDRWLSVCIASNLDSDLHYFTGVTKEEYIKEAKKQEVIKINKKINEDGTTSITETIDPSKYVRFLRKFNVQGKQSFVNERSPSDIKADFLVFLSFAVIKDTDTFLNNSGKEYIASMNAETTRKVEFAKKQEEEKIADEKIAKEFMTNPPKDTLQNTCWVYSGQPNTPETKKWLDSLSKSEQIALVYGASQGTMWNFKEKGIAWFGKDLIKTATCSVKQNKLEGKISCPNSEWEYKFANYYVLFMKGPKQTTWSSAYKRDKNMCM